MGLPETTADAKRQRDSEGGPNAQRPAVSVIVPCYKATAFIADLLEALRAQTFRNFETIVVNDACPDTVNLERALEPYRQEIRYIAHDVNQGVSAARNTAVRAAKGPVLSLMDPDDSCEPRYLEAQLAVLDSNPGLDVVSCNGKFFGDNPWAGRVLTVTPSACDFTFRNLLLGNCNVSNTGAIVRRDAVLREGLYDTNLRISEDFDLWLRLARSGSKFFFNNELLVRYRLRPDSLSDDKIGIQLATNEVLAKLLAIPDLTQEERLLLREAKDNREALADFYLGRKAIYAGDREESLRRFMGAAKMMKTPKLRVAIWMLRYCPALLFRCVRWRYRTEYAFLH